MSTTRTQQLLNRLRMRQVSLLLEIERQSTLRSAAAELGMTQPAATKMLHELESALGHQLFDRVGRGLQWTDSGRCVLGYFKGIQGNLDALTRNLGELELGGAGKLFIGSIMAASPAPLSQALIQLKLQYPLLTVEITMDSSDRLIETLRRGELDLVIGRIPLGVRDDFNFTPMSEEGLSVAVSPGHPLAGRPKVAFLELLDYPWILQPRGTPTRDLLEQEFKNNRAQPPKGLIETSSILITTNLLTESHMIAVIPTKVAVQYEAHGLLTVLRYRIRQRLNVFGSITARGRPPNAPVRRFQELLASGSVTPST